MEHHIQNREKTSFSSPCRISKEIHKAIRLAPTNFKELLMHKPYSLTIMQLTLKLETKNYFGKKCFLVYDFYRLLTNLISKCYLSCRKYFSNSKELRKSGRSKNYQLGNLIMQIHSLQCSSLCRICGLFNGRMGYLHF